MVDLNTFPPTPPAGERSKIKSFMGRTPGIGILKSKFLTVLGNSNELLNGISNKLTLSISSSDSEYCDDDEEPVPKFDESIDYTKIDFESRRVKARRAHEEIISGRYRNPNLAPRPRLEMTRSRHPKPKRSSSSSSSSSSTSSSSSEHSLPTNAIDRSQVSSTTRSNSIESRHSGGYGRPGRAIAGARRSDLDIQKDLMKINDLLKTGSGSVGMPVAPLIDVQPSSDKEEPIATGSGIGIGGATTSANSMRVPVRTRTSNSSTLTSLRDDPVEQISPSVESTDWRHFIRSESQNSVPSWASSISLDCRAGEEPIKEFMKRFTELLFVNASTIGLELKSEFGAMARLEIGRQWFTRFLLEQKLRSKRVDELCFHSLVQYFALVLFECGECEDYAPAAVVMNLCFYFYHEIEVPGCEPYREYLFTFMRQQPIWHTLRFWNAAFFEAVQSERDHRLALRLKRAEKRQRNKAPKATAEATKQSENVPPLDGNKFATTAAVAANQKVAAEVERETTSSSSSHHSNELIANVALHSALSRNGCAKMLDSGGGGGAGMDKEQLSETRTQENVVFRQLGAFTCNMHALGVSQDLCLEFAKKQATRLTLQKDKLKLIKDNIHRMYHETDLWGAKTT